MRNRDANVRIGPLARRFLGQGLQEREGVGDRTLAHAAPANLAVTAAAGKAAAVAARRGEMHEPDR
jgi:hypothetical protein